MRIAATAIGLFLVLDLLLGACATGSSRELLADGTAPAAGLRPGLPSLAELAALRQPLMLQGQAIPVTAPTMQQHTFVDGDSLLFTPPSNELAWAIYQVDPPFGELLTVSAGGTDTLWLIVADYGAGTWVFRQLSGGRATIDLTQLVDPLSPDGYLFTGLICQPGETGQLDSLSLGYDDYSDLDWNLQLTADADSIMLTWNELPVDGYVIVRSVLPADEAPYEVGSLEELHSGGNSFSETVPENGSGLWVPENRDNGTPADTADDFPALAPAVEYCYRIVPILRGKRGPASPEVSGMADWGARRTARRAWPDTTSQTQMFGFWINGDLLSEAQRQWCADNLAGAVDLKLADVEAIRTHNPDFIALNDSYAFLGSGIMQAGLIKPIHNYEDDSNIWPLYYGHEIDGDGFYPYVNRHEDWFIHDPDSTQPSQRVEASDEQYWLDMESDYRQYSGLSLLELLGEDSLDGWVQYGCTSLIRSSDLFYDQFGSASLYQYLLPRLDSYLTSIAADFGDHPLQPYLVAEAWKGFDLDGSEAGPCLDYSACDAVISCFIDGHVSGMEAMIGVFEDYVAPDIFTWQQAGQAVILNDDHIDGDGYPAGDPAEPFISYCCYLLLRNQATYFYVSEYWSPDQYPRWYPMYSWDSGAPLGPQPQSLADLEVGADYSRHLRRDFANGTVIVKPDSGSVVADPGLGVYYEYLKCDGGGIVDENGNVDGTAEWTPFSPPAAPGYMLTGPGAWIIRERPAP